MQTKREVAVQILESTKTLEALTEQLRELVRDIESSGAAVKRGREVLENLRREYKAMRDEYVGLKSMLCAIDHVAGRPVNAPAVMKS